MVGFIFCSNKKIYSNLVFFSRNLRLTNLINVAPGHSNTDKYRILMDITKCAAKNRCIESVAVGINQVKKWVKDWKVSTEQVQELYRSMHEAYAAAGDS